VRERNPRAARTTKAMYSFLLLLGEALLLDSNGESVLLGTCGRLSGERGWLRGERPDERNVRRERRVVVQLEDGRRGVGEVVWVRRAEHQGRLNDMARLRVHCEEGEKSATVESPSEEEERTHLERALRARRAARRARRHRVEGAAPLARGEAARVALRDGECCVVDDAVLRAHGVGGVGARERLREG